MREKKKKKIIILSMIGLLFIMAAGYAAFQTNLDIEGTSSINSNWDIRITNVTESNKNGEGETVSTNFTNLTAYMEANLYNKGDFVEYDVTIENKGTFDASLSDIITNVKSNNDAVKITFSGYTKGEVLYKNTTKTIKVKVEYNPDYEGDGEGSGEVEVEFTYDQAEGGTIVPTNKYLVTYDCVTNGGSDCTSYNEYLSEGSSINLTYQGTDKKYYKFVGWNTDSKATEGLTSLNMGSNDITLYAIYSEIDPTDPIISNVSTTTNTGSITVIVTASDDESNIVKYEYSKDGGKTWETGEGNTYTFTGLTQDTEYDIKVRVTNGVDKTAESDTKKVTTKLLEEPTFSEKEASGGKDITITYPEGCGDTLTCSYIKDNGKEVEVNESKVTVPFTEEGSLIAKVTDGTNEASSTYTVTIPAVIQSWGSSASTDFHAEEYRTNIITATFLDNKDVPDNAVASWDVSANKNGSVMAWVVADETDSSKYHLYIGGTNGVIANQNSSYLFRNFTALTGINFGDNFDTSNVTNMGSMFYNCSSLTSLDVSSFDTSKVTDVNFMFYGCSSLTSLDVSNFDTSNVTKMSYMFNECSQLTTLDVSNWDTSNVTYMNSMFSDCSSLATLDVSKWDTSNVTNMSYVFQGCSSLATLDVSKWDTSNVTNMRFVFQGCSNLATLDVSKWDTSSVTTMNRMFSDCSSLTNLDVSNFDTSNVTDMSSMFSDCSGLTKIDVSNFDTSNVTTMSNMFYNCRSLTDLDVSNFDTSSVTSMSLMFYKCSQLTDLDVSNWDTGNVTKMSNMFSSCSNLTDLDVSNWDTGNVTDMSSMFLGCSNLATLDVSNWDTGNVTTMSNMFYNCRSLTKLTLCSFDTNKVTNMNSMFQSTSKLTAIYVGPKWTTDNATTNYMFSGSGVSSVTQSDNCEVIANDTTAPTISFNPDGQSTYVSGGQTVTVTISDDESGIKSGQTIYYTWSLKQPNEWEYAPLQTIDNADGTKTVTIEVPKSASTDYSGDYYLNIKGGISDVAGNTSEEAVSKVFRFDNNEPELDFSTTSTTNSITVVADASAASGIAKYEYSKDGGKTWETGTSNTYTFTGLQNDTSYNIAVRVTSNVGKTTIKKSIDSIDITSDIVTSGDGLYEDEYEEGRYVYKGTDPNNYIEFNDELWRIIAKETDGTYKIIKNSVLLPAMVEWDFEDAMGNNDWTRPADLNTYLNGEYYDALTEDAKSYIVSHKWGIGTLTENNSDLATQIKDENSKEWTGNVALMSVSDYLRANSNIDDCGNYNLNNNNTCKHTNWLYSSIVGYPVWTINYRGNISINGDVYKISAVAGEGTIVSSSPSSTAFVLPSVYLNSGITLTGSGTQSDPFKIVDENAGISLKDIGTPTFSETQTATGKNVTIHYPEGCGSTYTCSYTNGRSPATEVTTDEVTVNFTYDGSLIAIVSDGTNEVSATHTVQYETHEITLMSNLGGSVKVENVTKGTSATANSEGQTTLEASTGDTIKVTSTPNSGFEQYSLTYDDDNKMDSGDTFIMPHADTTVNSIWQYINAFYNLKSSLGTTYLNKSTSATKVQLWNTTGSSSVWSIETDSVDENNVVYYIFRNWSGSIMGAASNGTSNNTQIDTYYETDSTSQKWYLDDNGDGTFSVKGMASNKCIDAASGKTDNGTNIQLYTCNQSNAQKWTMIKKYDNNYYNGYPVTDIYTLLDSKESEKSNTKWSTLPLDSDMTQSSTIEDATLVNFNNTSSSGWNDNGLRFDGTDDYAIFSMERVNSWHTLVVTFKFLSVNSSSTAEHNVLGNWQSGGGGLTSIGNRLICNYYLASTSSYVQAETTISANKVYTAACKYDGYQVSIWINGEKKASTKGTNKIVESAAPFAIGANPNTSGGVSGGYANMEVYSALHYGRGLSDDDIRTITNLEQAKYG